MAARCLMVLAAVAAVGLASCKDEGDIFVLASDRTAPTTTAIPPGGSYSAGQWVTLFANEPATIYYTTDGSDPTDASSTYTAPVTVMNNMTLKFFARDEAGNTEAIKTEQYMIVTWTKPSNLSSTAEIAQMPTVEVDSSDVVHAAWSEDYPANSAYDVFYSNSINWASKTNVTDSSTDSYNPEMTTDASDVVHMTWSEGIDVFYANSANWTVQTNASSSGPTSLDSTIGVATTGVVHMAYAEVVGAHWDIYYTNSTTWPTTRVNITNSPSSDSQGPKGAIDSNNLFHIAWRERVGGVNYETYYANSSDWGTLTNISNSPDPTVSPAIAVGPDDTVHVVWQQYVGSVFEVMYANSSDWAGTLENISNTPYDSYRPDIAVGSDGTVHVVWEEDSTEVYYANSFSWSLTRQNVSDSVDDSRNPAVAVDSTQAVHIVWVEIVGGSNAEIYYVKSGS
jgi:hypothetical protein